MTPLDLHRQVNRTDYPDMVGDVREFLNAFGHHVGSVPGPPDSLATHDLRVRLVVEEWNELAAAVPPDGGVDLPAMTDAIADLIYVLIGMAWAWGVDLRPVWKAVHAANLSKKGGPRRDDGKQQKPENWLPPDIEGILRAQGWEVQS